MFAMCLIVSRSVRMCAFVRKLTSRTRRR